MCINSPRKNWHSRNHKRSHYKPCHKPNQHHNLLLKQQHQRRNHNHSTYHQLRQHQWRNHNLSTQRQQHKLHQFLYRRPRHQHQWIAVHLFNRCQFKSPPQFMVQPSDQQTFNNHSDICDRFDHIWNSKFRYFPKCSRAKKDKKKV